MSQQQQFVGIGTEGKTPALLVSADASPQVGRGRGRTAYARFLEFLRGTGHRLGHGPLTTFFRRGLLASEVEYREGLSRRDGLVRPVDVLFARHDLWVLPASPGVAIRRQRPGPGKPVGKPRRLKEVGRPTVI